MSAVFDGWMGVWVKVRLSTNAVMAVGNVIEGRVSRVEDGCVWLELADDNPWCEIDDPFIVINCDHVVYAVVTP